MSTYVGLRLAGFGKALEDLASAGGGKSLGLGEERVGGSRRHFSSSDSFE